MQDGRVHIEKINGPFLYQLKGTPAEYKTGLDRAIAKWLARPAWIRHLREVHRGGYRAVPPSKEAAASVLVVLVVAVLAFWPGLALQLIEDGGDDAQHLGAQLFQLRRAFGRSKVAHRHPTQAIVIRGIQVPAGAKARRRRA